MIEDIRNVFSADPDVIANPSTEHHASSQQSTTLVTTRAGDTQSDLFASVNRSTIGVAAATAIEEDRVPLFIPSVANELRGRWDSVQAGFVDEPRKAVQEADALVSTAVKRLSESFGDERKKLEAQWESGDISTEDLRLAVRHYRSFFSRLLSF